MKLAPRSLPMLFLRVRPKRKHKALDEKQLEETIERELQSRNYMSREDLRGYLAEIERDEKKKRAWDSMPVRKKIKVLRYVMAKKGEKYGKK